MHSRAHKALLCVQPVLMQLTSHRSPAAGKTHSLHHPLSCCAQYHYNYQISAPLHQCPRLITHLLSFEKRSSTFAALGSHGCGSLLTEIEELLHGKRRWGEFGEMFDVFGRTGQSGAFHDKPDELHCCSWFLRTPLAEPAPRLLCGKGEGRRQKWRKLQPMGRRERSRRLTEEPMGGEEGGASVVCCSQWRSPAQISLSPLL